MKKNRILAVALALALAVGIAPAYAAAPRFSDVTADHWAYSHIEDAAADGAVNGVGNNRFDPDGILTVAEWSCILARAFYGNEVEAKAKTTWYNREVEVLQEHHILGSVNDFQLSASASRIQMAETVANLMKDKSVTADASKVAAAKAEIADLDSIYPMHHEAVATCWALGIINGVGGGRFDGNGNMERAAASAVYSRVKNVLAGAPSGSENPPVIPTPPTTVSPVGTMSSTRLNLGKNDIASHAPITDSWAQQSMEMRNISDRDAFNAACQTIKDSNMILTQGEINTLGRNLYYNYAVVAQKSDTTQKNVDDAMGALCGHGGDYGLQGSGYRFYTIRPLRAATTSAPRFASTIAQINANPGVTDKEKAALCVKAVCDQLTYQAYGGNASWDNGGSAGSCVSFARMLNQILSAAGIPNINLAGNNHAWVQAKLDGQWYVLDATMVEVGYDSGITSFSEHEQLFGYSGLNNTDVVKVARALIDAAYPTN